MLAACKHWGSTGQGRHMIPSGKTCIPTGVHIDRSDKLTDKIIVLIDVKEMNSELK